ncbi:fumarate/nitrate reduction transcriptional regulator Fnr [Marinomonas fungiae]|uniref:cAMP-binding domain of CRP or a regulatory subunit of cAMP-dependent protein kinases n=1 Tax=Marinomonas fungiae TaxID=1137284 RepID=A0A0K6ILM7_9GAMM|nr:fumarate/nitrate reduction transcriptional regulator Fnr [Marinomonas fungiae]CUB04003.1 cAMP-binding domain of CRP or a regulatory subunit of cAMP-dependent protein kinases [Marinomonas fungiae]
MAISNSNNRFSSKLTSQCQNCSLSALCLPIALADEDVNRLDQIIERKRPLKKGEILFHQGEEFDSVFAVRTGTLKTYNITNSGEEQITGFYCPSELVGLSGIDENHYPVSAKALETTTVCEIPFSHLEQLSSQIPSLKHQLFRLMSRKICDDQQMMVLLGKKNADEKVASFLLNLSHRFKKRGYSATAYRLSMSRGEIGNYLGLAVETVSRVMTRFQKNGLIDVDGKEISIINLPEMEKLVGAAGECATIEHV